MNSRLFWFVVGCVIGVVIGYIVRSLREIKEEVDEVHKRVTQDRATDEGFISLPRMKNLALLFVVLLTAYAAIQSQRATNKLSDQQHRNDAVVACNQTFLQGTLAALNARTTYTVEQSNANVELQKAFNKVVLASLQVPPITEPEARKIVTDYAAALAHFLDVSGRTSNTVADNPYPTPTAFLDCLTKK